MNRDPSAADLTITMRDVMLAGHCARGARRWFSDHGFDFRAFLKSGIDAQTFVDKGDALSARVVELKRRRMAG